LRAPAAERPIDDAGETRAEVAAVDERRLDRRAVTPQQCKRAVESNDQCRRRTLAPRARRQRADQHDRPPPEIQCQRKQRHKQRGGGVRNADKCETPR